jgi:hypothetical protein
MDRQTLRHYLAQADDDIDQATERLERHSRMMEELRLSGRDMSAANELMGRFERALESIRSDRQVILDLLGRPRGRRRGEASPRQQAEVAVVVQRSFGFSPTTGHSSSD